MVTTEDIYAAADGAGLLKLVTWLPEPAAVPVTAKVLFRAPDEVLLNGLALGRDYTMTYPLSALSGIAPHARVAIDGSTYEIREIRIIGDGTEVRATLSGT